MSRSRSLVIRSAIAETATLAPSQVKPFQLPTGLAGSRDRVYLSFTVRIVGLSIWRNDLWLIVTLIPVIAFLATIAIPREERLLNRHFHDHYSSHKATVRRWLQH